MSCFGKLFITMFNSIINKLFCSKLTHVLGKIKESNYPCNVHTLVTCTYTVSLNSVPFLKGDYSVQYYIQLSSRLLPPPHQYKMESEFLVKRLKKCHTPF